MLSIRGNTIPARKAWTGGDLPRRGIVLADSPIGRQWRFIRHLYFREQLAEWVSYWGDMPDKNTRKIFWNRANLDAWATIR